MLRLVPSARATLNVVGFIKDNSMLRWEGELWVGSNRFPGNIWLDLVTMDTQDRKHAHLMRSQGIQQEEPTNGKR